ncbi:MAG: exodeoxyribonuclease VII small subunit [Pseudomonadota bacterium]
MAKQNFESALKRLEEIVDDLDSSDLSLEESLKRFEEGVKLSRFCSERLDEIEKKVSILMQDKEGGLTEKTFEAEEKEDVDIL